MIFIKERFLKFAAILVIVVLVVASVALNLDIKIREMINNYSESKAMIVANNIVGDSISTYLKEGQISYSNLCNISRDYNGEITSIEINSVLLNIIQNDMITDVQKQISEIENIPLNMPVGTLTGNEFLIGRGPELVINAHLSSAVLTDVHSEFYSSGINQTLHRVYITVSIEVYFVMPWYQRTEVIDNDFLIAETVIVGKVPSSYTIVNDDGDDDQTEKLFYYKED